MARIDAHEKFCEAMTKNTNDVIHEMKDALANLSKVAIGLLIAISGWALVELYGKLSPAPTPTTTTVTRTIR